jgi:hypothetical protein
VIEKYEQNDVLGDFTKRLDKIGIEYMLVGSMALVHYAMPRATVDIDIVLKISPENIDKFIAEFENDYYIPINRAKQAARQKGMFNLLNNQTILKIDCVILKENEFEKNAFARRRKVDYSGEFEVCIISKEDLILSKLLWAKKSGSERQLLDVASIIRNGYDKTYVSEWIEKLELQNVFEQSLELLKQNYDDRYNS